MRGGSTRGRRSATTRLVRWALGLLSGLSPATAQVSPADEQFQVNLFTTSYQAVPEVASDGSGRFVVVWDSYGSTGGDSSSFSIQARRFAADGSPLGGQFQINFHTTLAQEHPSVASDSDGNFVVVWDSNSSTGTDTDGRSVHGQRFGANGATLGPQFQVNLVTSGTQASAAVARHSQGSFVIVWESASSFGTDTTGYSIQAQRYSTAGTPLGDPFQVNSYTAGDQLAPDVAIDGLGNFVIAWASYGSGGDDTSGDSIQARRFAPDGTPLAEDFQVNSYTTGVQGQAAVSSDGLGNFVVVWTSSGSGGTDTSEFSVQAQRFDAVGDPLGEEFQVNSHTPNKQLTPTIASDAAGNLVIVWASDSSEGGDTNLQSIQARRYAANGTALDDQFQVNTYTTQRQWTPAVSSDPRGNWVVAWDSTGSSGTDTAGSSIQAQRYDGLFRDDFETGGTLRWSASAP